MTSTDPTAVPELDARGLSRADRHPAIMAAYAGLPVGGAFILVNDHDPLPLRGEFEAGHPGSHGWDYLDRGPSVWRIRITKLASTPLPRVLLNTRDVAADTGAPGASGAVWNVPVPERDLDSNIIALEPGGAIDAFAGPELDVMIHVLGGTGALSTERGDLELVPGALVWLPRRSRRAFTAGPEGLRYLTVHQKRQSLLLQPTRTLDGS
ncbi:DUF2249 domain-containing protein [Arthrobacter sp. JSM 101049]|uniref:DUF2249 domain-containing protein n=1 Tax=Arthrobacter sp. JSM 101049 TaxID=929097 RepID=UPI0035633E0D